MDHNLKSIILWAAEYSQKWTWQRSRRAVSTLDQRNSIKAVVVLDIATIGSLNGMPSVCNNSSTVFWNLESWIELSAIHSLDYCYAHFFVKLSLELGLFHDKMILSVIAIAQLISALLWLCKWSFAKSSMLPYPQTSEMRFTLTSNWGD